MSTKECKYTNLALSLVAVVFTMISICVVVQSDRRMDLLEQHVRHLQMPAVDAVVRKGMKSPIKHTPQELECLATNIYHEARGESLEGKIAVAHVTVNRVWHHRYPNTVCDVVYQARYYVNWKGNRVPRRHQCQFSWYCDGKPDHIVLADSQGRPIVPNVRAWRQSMQVAQGVLEGSYPDNTGSATHYFNPDLADPHWQKVYDQVAVVDNHAFYVSTY